MCDDIKGFDMADTHSHTAAPVVAKLAMNVFNKDERNSVFIFENYINDCLLEYHIMHREVVIALCSDWLPF